MRVKKISANNIQPVELFEVDNLSDLVVIAGPNGVGKSRLVAGLLHYLQNLSGQDVKFTIEATHKSEVDSWGKRILETDVPEDAEHLRLLLRQNRRRRRL